MFFTTKSVNVLALFNNYMYSPLNSYLYIHTWILEYKDNTIIKYTLLLLLNTYVDVFTTLPWA